MPIYEYKCADCADTFEIMTSRSQRQKHPACSKCGGHSTERVMSTFSGRSRSGTESRQVGGSACAGCAAKSCATCQR